MPGPVQAIELESKPGRWRLFRAAPDADLAGLVKEYWEVEGTLAPFRETILPTGWLEVMVSLGPPHRVLSGASTGVWNGGWFSGLHEGAIGIESMHGTHLVSARLHPLGALELLGPVVPACANRIVGLEHLLGDEAHEFTIALQNSERVEERFILLEALLRRRRDALNRPQEFVLAAAAEIEAKHGAVRVSELHTKAQVSRRHFITTFTAAVGISPRAYAKLHRFAWTLERLRNAEMVDWAGLALEAGYSDQSHLIRDFRRIGGTSAGAYLPRLAPGGISLWGTSDSG